MWNPEKKFQEYLVEMGDPLDEPSEIVSQVSMIHCCLEYGWMEAMLKIMDLTIRLNISNNYPPFMDQVKWLEKIIEGQSPAVWRFDDELRDHYFRASHLKGETLILQYMRYSFPSVELYACAKVSKRQLILDCYYSLMHMIDIDRKQSQELIADVQAASLTSIYSDLQFRGRVENACEETVWFEIDPDTDEVIRPNLSRIAEWLRSTAEDITPGSKKWGRVCHCDIYQANMVH